MVTRRSNSDKIVDKNTVNRTSGVTSTSHYNLKEESKDKDIIDIKQESNSGPKISEKINHDPNNTAFKSVFPKRSIFGRNQPVRPSELLGAHNYQQIVNL